MSNANWESTTSTMRYFLLNLLDDKVPIDSGEDLDDINGVTTGLYESM